MIKYNAVLEPDLGMIIEADTELFQPEKCKILLMEQVPDTNFVTFEIKVENVNQLYTLKLRKDGKMYIFKDVNIDLTNNTVRYKDPVEVKVSFFTFGYGQTYSGHYIEIICNTDEDPREIMIEGHGIKWSMEYVPSQWYLKEDDEPTLAHKWCWSRLLSIMHVPEACNGYEGNIIIR